MLQMSYHYELMSSSVVIITCKCSTLMRTSWLSCHQGKANLFFYFLLHFGFKPNKEKGDPGNLKCVKLAAKMWLHETNRIVV